MNKKIKRTCIMLATTLILIFAIKANVDPVGAYQVTTTTIDWTTFPDGSPIPNETEITDQFQSLGIVFLSPPGPPRVLDSLGGILISGGPTGFFGEIHMLFIDTGNGLPAAITIEIIGSGLNISASLEAFDSYYNSIGGVTHTYTGPTGQLSPFTFNAPESKRIAHAIYNGGLNPSAAASIGTLIIQYPSSGEVIIDIQPNKFPNIVYPTITDPKDYKGLVHVSVLTTPNFDARTVDPTTVRFGPAGASAIQSSGVIKDVDRDGDADITFGFRIAYTGIKCGDTSASLSGITFEGQSFMGSDSIQTMDCTPPYPYP